MEVRIKNMGLLVRWFNPRKCSNDMFLTPVITITNPFRGYGLYHLCFEWLYFAVGISWRRTCKQKQISHHYAFPIKL